jgi:hypothetical protein
MNFDNFSEAVTHLSSYWLLLNQRPEAAVSAQTSSPTV